MPVFQCPLCGNEQGIPHLAVSEVYTIMRCGACGALSTYPMPPRDKLHALYNQRYYGGSQASRFRSRAADAAQQLFRWCRALTLQRRLGTLQGRRVLDIGCDRGTTLAWLQRWGADVHGVQLSAPAAAMAAARVGERRIFVGELADAAYPDAWFDCITLWHVLEHVPHPPALLREIRRILKPGGLVYIEVPNAGGWSARTCGRHWLAYDVPKHLVHFTPDTLQAAVARAAGG